MVHVDFDIVQHDPSTGLEDDRSGGMQREDFAALFGLRQDKSLRGLLDLDSKTRRKILSSVAKAPAAIEN